MNLLGITNNPGVADGSGFASIFGVLEEPGFTNHGAANDFGVTDNFCITTFFNFVILLKGLPLSTLIV